MNIEIGYNELHQRQNMSPPTWHYQRDLYFSIHGKDGKRSMERGLVHVSGCKGSWWRWPETGCCWLQHSPESWHVPGILLKINESTKGFNNCNENYNHKTIYSIITATTRCNQIEYTTITNKQTSSDLLVKHCPGKWHFSHCRFEWLNKWMKFRCILSIYMNVVLSLSFFGRVQFRQHFRPTSANICQHRPDNFLLILPQKCPLPPNANDDQPPVLLFHFTM